METVLKLEHLKVNSIVEKINSAKSIILSTHKQCDGDGLGAIIGLYYALKKANKDVRLFTVDEVPRKYHFLKFDEFLEIFEEPHAPIEATDLCLIFDTNDFRMVEPLYSEVSKKCTDVLFVDHHPILNDGPEPNAGSYIDTTAASTGEIAYSIIKALNIDLDANIARALYTSIVFDTQLFRFVKSAEASHLISAELIKYEKDPEEIHRELFSTYTIGKVAFLGHVLSKIEYHSKGQVAVLLIKDKYLHRHNLDVDDSRDIIDMIMNIRELKCAALFREITEGQYKLSLRSKGKAEILSVAESFQGGGHLYAAGAYIEGDYEKIKQQTVDLLTQKLKS